MFRKLAPPRSLFPPLMLRKPRLKFDPLKQNHPAYDWKEYAAASLRCFCINLPRSLHPSNLARSSIEHATSALLF